MSYHRNIIKSYDSEPSAGFSVRLLKGLHQPKSHEIVETNGGSRRVFQLQEVNRATIPAAAVRRRKSYPFDFERKTSPGECSLITLNSFLSGHTSG